MPGPIPAAVTALLYRFRDDLLAVPWVERAMLYGSFARGDWCADSDVDLAVFLSPDTPCGLEQYMALSRLCRSSDYDVQVQIFGIDELDTPCGIMEEVAAYGVDLNVLDL